MTFLYTYKNCSHDVYKVYKINYKVGKQIIFKGRGWWKVVIIVIKHSENLMNVTEFRLKKRSPSYLVYKKPVTEKLIWGCGPININNVKASTCPFEINAKIW